jgi:hypothetical protein
MVGTRPACPQNPEGENTKLLILAICFVGSYVARGAERRIYGCVARGSLHLLSRRKRPSKGFLTYEIILSGIHDLFCRMLAGL